MAFPLRSPSATTCGIVFFARFIDKIRLDAESGLPPGYHVGFVEGSRTFDDRFMRLWEFYLAYCEAAFDEACAAFDGASTAA